jgi:hypothetical protein
LCGSGSSLSKISAPAPLSTIINVYFLRKKFNFFLGMHRIFGRPDIRPDNPAFYDIRYPAEYRIALPDIRPDIR